MGIGRQAPCPDGRAGAVSWHCPIDIPLVPGHPGQVLGPAIKFAKPGAVKVTGLFTHRGQHLGLLPAVGVDVADVQISRPWHDASPPGWTGFECDVATVRAIPRFLGEGWAAEPRRSSTRLREPPIRSYRGSGVDGPTSTATSVPG